MIEGIRTNVVALVVTRELGDHLEMDLNSYVDYMVVRAEAHYQADKSFQNLLQARPIKGKEMLYSFMRFWLANKLGRDFPRLKDSIPPHFKRGRPIEGEQ